MSGVIPLICFYGAHRDVFTFLLVCDVAISGGAVCYIEVQGSTVRLLLS